MQKLKIVIADDNEKMVRLLEDIISTDKSITLVGKAYDGESLIKIIENEHPDIVLLDIIMPKIDGLTVIEKVNTNHNIDKKPYFIIISAINQSRIIEAAFNFGAEYYILKPFEKDVLLNRINGLKFANQLSCYNKIESHLINRSIEIDVTNILREIGIPAHIKGYKYLRDAIIFSVEDVVMLTSVTKILYPAVAKKHYTTPSRVERAIRHAIEITFHSNKTDTMNELFGYTLGNGKLKPTNSEFIALIVDKMELIYKNI